MDYNELMTRTGLYFTTEEYEAFQRVFVGTDIFNDGDDAVRFFKKYGKEKGMETIKSIDYREILAERKNCDRIYEERERMNNILHEKELQYIDSRREVKELKDELARAKEIGEIFAKEKEAKDTEIAKLNALLDAYRKVVDLSGFSQDELVMSLANSGVRL